MLVTDPHPQVVDCAAAVLRVADVELAVMPVSLSLGAPLKNHDFTPVTQACVVL